MASRTILGRFARWYVKEPGQSDDDYVKVEGIKEIMQKSTQLGMQTFDQALFNLYQEGKISEEEALKNADSKNNLALRMRLVTKKNAGKAAPSEAAKGGDDA